jgi:hypothetical protein
VVGIQGCQDIFKESDWRHIMHSPGAVEEVAIPGIRYSTHEMLLRLAAIAVIVSPVH